MYHIRSLSFVSPLPLRLSQPRTCLSYASASLTLRRNRKAAYPLRTPIRSQSPSQAPDYAAGFFPDGDADYEEVRVLSLGPSRHDSSLLTLHPLCGGDLAFKMSVTTAQVDSIRAAFADMSCCKRPCTHDLLKTVLNTCGAHVIKAAITHMSDDVFIARVWIRVQDEEFHVDSRPSDAIALSLRSKAPLFLNTKLLKQWNMDVDVIERDARHGLCERIHYADSMKTSRSLHVEVRNKPELLRLAMLKMRLDVAVRLQRFAEADVINKFIDDICPLDRLERELKRAVNEQRFLDASAIQDKITVWRARVRMWERQAMDARGGDKSDFM